MTQEEKIKALADALSRTEDILMDFRDVVRHDFTDHENPLDDFTAVAEAIVADNGNKVRTEAKPEPSSERIPVSAPEQEKSPEDPRFRMGLEALNKEALLCSRCRLCKERTSVVFGEGCSLRPDVMVIGEAPGENEDATGRPFVGAAGQFLDKWLAAISVSRERNAYITNTLKCRPPMNRDPQTDELQACRAFLLQQIRCVKPKSILCLGKPASIAMTGKADSTMGQLRGRFTFHDGIPVLCTYHPSAVLRNPELKRDVWEDLKKLAIFMGLEIGGARR